MNIQQIILKLYESFYKRLDTVILPICYLMLILTSISLDFVLSETPFTKLFLITVHSISGIILCMLTILLIYDEWTYFYYSKKELTQNKISRKSMLANHTSFWKKMMDFVFYVLLLFLCISGICMFFLKKELFQISLGQYLFIVLFHKYIAWTFSAFLCIKCYLIFTSGIQKLKFYLKQ